MQTIIAGPGVAAVARRLRNASDQPADRAGGPEQRVSLRDPQEHLRDNDPATWSSSPSRVVARERPHSPTASSKPCGACEVVGPKGRKVRLLDEVDLITGVSGGSFTALAYGLYGDKLFDIYEASFLKRNVQGELIRRILNPAQLGSAVVERLGPLGSGGAALRRYPVPRRHIRRSRPRRRPADHRDRHRHFDRRSVWTFQQSDFDYLCSDLDAVPLSRAAAASSAVPLVLSAVTFNNYGGSCKFAAPQWAQAFSDPETAPRPAARAVKTMQELEAYQDGVHKPYIHLVDGGLADNLGMRGVLETLEELEALKMVGQPTPLDHVRRIVVFVVNSQSSPKTNWDKSARPPGDLAIMLKATGVPIDHYLLRGGRAVAGHHAAVAKHAPDSGIGSVRGEHGSRAGAARRTSRTSTSMPSTCPSPRSRTRRNSNT